MTRDLRILATLATLEKRAETVGDLVSKYKIPYSNAREVGSRGYNPDYSQAIPSNVAKGIMSAARAENEERAAKGQEPLIYSVGESLSKTPGQELPSLSRVAGTAAVVGGVPFAVAGGAVGAAIGALSSLIAQRKGKRTPGRNALIGAGWGAGLAGLAGAGLGGAAGVWAHTSIKDNPVVGMNVRTARDAGIEL